MKRKPKWQPYCASLRRFPTRWLIDRPKQKPVSIDDVFPLVVCVEHGRVRPESVYRNSLEVKIRPGIFSRFLMLPPRYRCPVCGRDCMETNKKETTQHDTRNHIDNLGFFYGGMS